MAPNWDLWNDIIEKSCDENCIFLGRGIVNYSNLELVCNKTQFSVSFHVFLRLLFFCFYLSSCSCAWYSSIRWIVSNWYLWKDTLEKSFYKNCIFLGREILKSSNLKNLNWKFPVTEQFSWIQIRQSIPNFKLTLAYIFGILWNLSAASPCPRIQFTSNAKWNMKINLILLNGISNKFYDAILMAFTGNVIWESGKNFLILNLRR